MLTPLDDARVPLLPQNIPVLSAVIQAIQAATR
jgi:hypothetical protein